MKTLLNASGASVRELEYREERIMARHGVERLGLPDGFTVVDYDPARQVLAITEEVPLWAFRAILTVRGLAGQVTTLISALPEPTQTIARTQWEYANFIKRGHPLIAALGAQLGMSSSEIDQVFIEANALS